MYLSITKKVLLLLTLFSLIGCSEIVIKVNKKGKSQNNQESADAQKVEGTRTSDDISIDDVRAYLKDVDQLKEDVAELIIEELRSGEFRGKFRKALRDLRSNIKRNAGTEHSYRNDLFSSLNDLDCDVLEKKDLKAYADDHDLGVLLKGSLLAKLSLAHAKKLKISLPEDFISEVEHIFAVEMGFHLEGETNVTEDGNTVTTTSTVVWNIDSENDESQEMIADDHLDVKFIFTWVTVDGEDRKFNIEVVVQEGLYLGQATGPRYFLNLSTHNYRTDNNGYKVVSTAKNGVDGDIKYSRKMVFVRDGENKELYDLWDIARYGLENEDVRRATIDFGELKKCLAKDDEDGKGDKGEDGSEDWDGGPYDEEEENEETDPEDEWDGGPYDEDEKSENPEEEWDGKGDYDGDGKGEDKGEEENEDSPGQNENDNPSQSVA